MKSGRWQRRVMSAESATEAGKSNFYAMETHPAGAGDASPTQVGEGALPRFFSVTQYNRSIERLVKREVPKVWVQGTITQLNVRGRVAYMTLAEFETDDAKPKATIDVFLWSAELDAFNARFAKLPLPFSLKAMLKVAFQLEPGFYVPNGRFQPHITDVDPRFTLGELALTRQKILAALRRDGLLTRNKELPLAECPLRIGLITAQGSAAYQDFTTVLLNSGFGFEMLFVGARMQGDNTEASVVVALRRLQALKPDCICLVRGGGARTDLVYFDSEAICRAIATCTVPVLTGIGHEIDRSLADEVAHADLITPTDCAKFLEERLQEVYGALAEKRRELSRSWRENLQQASLLLADSAQTVNQAFASAQARERERTSALVARMQQATRFHLEEAHLHLQRNAVGLRRGPVKMLAASRWKLRHRGQQLRGAWAQQRGVMAEVLGARRQKVMMLWPLHLQRCREELKRGGKTVAGALRLAWKHAGESLEMKSRWLRTTDPAFVMRLGYALIRDAKGTAVSRADQVQAGSLLTVEWQDGQAQTEVKQVKKNKATPNTEEAA